MSDLADGARRFLQLHRSERPLLLPNPWDVGSARILVGMGFKALATTSSGAAAAVGLRDGQIGREAAISHAQMIGAASGLAVNADLENGFADEPVGVAETILLAIDAGIVGASVEDWSGSDIYPIALATERVAAAAEAAHSGSHRLVLTARAENHIRDRDELDDTIRRLQAYERAGADVLYAPGLQTLEDITAVLASVSLPLNVLALPGVPPVSELAAAGVSRVSVGGAFAFAAYGALAEAAAELHDQGTFGYLAAAGRGSAAVRGALASAAGTAV